MNATALVCENGWTALYDENGNRTAVHPPSEPEEHLKLMRSGFTVEVQNVPVNPKFKDFPLHL